MGVALLAITPMQDRRGSLSASPPSVQSSFYIMDLWQCRERRCTTGLCHCTRAELSKLRNRVSFNPQRAGSFPSATELGGASLKSKASCRFPYHPLVLQERSLSGEMCTSLIMSGRGRPRLLQGRPSLLHRTLSCALAESLQLGRQADAPPDDDEHGREAARLLPPAEPTGFLHRQVPPLLLSAQCFCQAQQIAPHSSMRFSVLSLP